MDVLVALAKSAGVAKAPMMPLNKPDPKPAPSPPPPVAQPGGHGSSLVDRIRTVLHAHKAAPDAQQTGMTPKQANAQPAAQLCRLLDAVAHRLPLNKTAGIRAMQHTLAGGATLGQAIKTAYPALNGPCRGILAANLVRSLAKTADAYCGPTSNSVPMSTPKSYSGSVGGGMGFMKQADPLGDAVVPEGLAAAGGVAGSGILGSLLGAPLGMAAGAARGNVSEGLGRGIVRGGATGTGAGLGALLGHLAAKGMGQDPSAVSGLVGGGLGGLAGYMGSGALMGEAAGGKKKEEDA